MTGPVDPTFDETKCPSCGEHKNRIMVFCVVCSAKLEEIPETEADVFGPGKIGIRKKNDPVNHPSHYTNHPSGIECIQITQHMGFCLGNAFKYIWRADLKQNAIQDMEKAIFYINQEIEKRKNEKNT